MKIGLTSYSSSIPLYGEEELILSFRELLSDYYQIHPEEKVMIDDRAGFLSDGYFYFNMESRNLETIQMEQTVLAYYLRENGIRQMALPIKNMKEEWFTEYRNSKFLIYQVTERNMKRESPGRSLALFHQIGSTYGFEPQTISSYGEWKRLWIDKLTLFEEGIHQQVEDRNAISKILLDTLPYIIGMSENAIQYLRETEETESRFSEMDQGTVTFLRFQDQFNREVLWPDQLGYDHPARDLAEYIRLLLLTGQSEEALLEFIRDYQIIRPLTLFSWRLVYARLLFPIHLFDAMEPLLISEHPSGKEEEYLHMIDRQGKYEERLRDFFMKVGIDKGEAGLTEVEWL